MGDKTSHRRLNPKPRDPMAKDLGDDKYHQRVIPKKKKRETKYDDDWYE